MHFYSRKNIILLLALLSATTALGQSDSLLLLKGRVVCKGRPVPYATLQLQGTSIGVSCNDAGELVRVYDMGGNLVAAQRAGSFCLFNLLPNYKAPFVDDWNRFILQIGNRPPIQIGI